MSQPFRGIFPIPKTPFDEWGNLLWDDFDREVDWTVRAGAHGLVWPVLASEYQVLSFPERVEGMKRIIDVVAGRIPVVIGVADTSKAGAMALAEAAARAGADAIIAMPPWATKLSTHELVEDYYRGLADAGGLPIFIQNIGPPMGSNLPGKFVVELCERIPLVQYLKEEKEPKGQALSEVLAFDSPHVKGVFSGSQCHWLISDYQRGVSGSMPATYLTDVDVQIWEALEAGDYSRARRIHNAKLVLENILAGLPPGGVAGKEVLRRRGVISSAAIRGGGRPVLDEVDQAELEYGLQVVAPYFRL